MAISSQGLLGGCKFTVAWAPLVLYYLIADRILLASDSKLCTEGVMPRLSFHGLSPQCYGLPFRAVLNSGSTSAEGTGEKSKDTVTTYVAIFTVHPATKQQILYRHFLR